MATLEQRVGQLEGAYQHLATKADLAQLDRHGYCAALGLGGPLWWPRQNLPYGSRLSPKYAG